MSPDGRGGGDLAEVLKAALDQVNKTTKVYPTPGPDFDVSTASEKELVHFGLPVRPDMGTQHEAHAFWVGFFSPKIAFLPVVFAFPPLEALYHFNPRGAPPAGVRHEASSNWSGGYITPHDGRMFTHLYGSWHVPGVTIPAGSTQPASAFRASNWIGLDGQRRYINSSLPQIGTSSHFDTSGAQPVAVAEAWWQWWSRNNTMPPFTLPLPVKPGDEVKCMMIVVDPKTVKFLIKNETTGQVLTAFDATAPVDNSLPSGPIQLEVSGATAEWITERPDIYPTDVAYAFPDYGSVTFSDCIALPALAPGQPTDPPSGLRGARLIKMFEVREHPSRIADISLAQFVHHKGRRAIRTRYR